MQAAFDWDRAGRPKEKLYGGDVLQLALSTTDRARAGSIVDDFLTASEDREHERQLAARVEAEQQRAEEQAGEARRFRALAIFALALGVIAFIAAIGAFQGQRSSNIARATSDAARATSDVALTAANSALEAQAQLVGQLLTATVESPSSDDLPMGGETSNATPTAEAPDITTPRLPPTPTAIVGGMGETTEEPVVGVELPTVDFAGATLLALPMPTAPQADSLQDQLNNIRATQAAITGSVGQSVRGQPIEVYRFGGGPAVTLLIGGLNGGFAPASSALAQRAIDYFSANPDAIPAVSAVHIIPNANPDSPRAPGEIAGRLNANDVDLNRNFDCNWTASVEFRGERISAGSSAFSEPETQALRDYIDSVRPAAVIIYGARASNGWVVPGFCAEQDAGANALAERYTGASGYEQRSVAISGSGESIDWLAARGVPAIYVLLRSYDALSEADWTANLEAILATLGATARN